MFKNMKAKYIFLNLVLERFVMQYLTKVYFETHRISKEIFTEIHFEQRMQFKTEFLRLYTYSSKLCLYVI